MICLFLLLHHLLSPLLPLSRNSAMPNDDLASTSTSSSDFANDAVSSHSSSSSSSSTINYLWIPLLMSLSKELGLARAAHPSSILMPTQLQLDSTNFGPSCPALNPKLNYQPVIGILSHPGDGASGRLSNATNASYIAASYVKFVESAGARVIPLIYNEPMEILFEKLNLVNGVLFTGGWAKRGLYFSVAEKIFQEILKRNDAGDHFPLYAICLGFEIVSMIISKDMNILEPFNASDMASTLQFVENIKVKGTVFNRYLEEESDRPGEILGVFNQFLSCKRGWRCRGILSNRNKVVLCHRLDLLRKLETDCLVMQNHRYGISPRRFLQNQSLASFFKILTTCVDGDDKVYVSTVQGHTYPVTAFQWHPEKNAFEWGFPTIPHSEEAIEVTQYVANYLVSESRKSLNRPTARKVLDNLIYNYSPTYCGKAGRGYDEVYIFESPPTKL